MLKLTNKFQVLQELYDEEKQTSTPCGKGVKNALTLTCQEVLGPKKPQQKDLDDSRHHAQDKSEKTEERSPQH